LKKRRLQILYAVVDGKGEKERKKVMISWRHKLQVEKGMRQEITPVKK